MTEPEPIPGEQARAILENAIRDELGDDWADDGWVVVTNHDYMARLNKARINVDFYVDYFDGSVNVETKEVSEGQEAGRMFAWILLAIFAVITLLVARALGYF